MQGKRDVAVPEALLCPVCRAPVAATSSMCLSCHLPIKDVAANQHRRPSRSASRRGRRLRRLVSGVLIYVALVWWCWLQLPTALLFVVPAAAAGVWLHAVKGRPWLGLIAFVAIVAVVPLVFWPSMLTGLFSDLAAGNR
ncbi:MAG TPA: hypothetical protein VFG63_16970 [Nocardioidaceae bacterium]|nr:hypothetical protein [Nocardioidaceae bacterium]